MSATVTPGEAGQEPLSHGLSLAGRPAPGDGSSRPQAFGPTADSDLVLLQEHLAGGASGAPDGWLDAFPADARRGY